MKELKELATGFALFLIAFILPVLAITIGLVAAGWQ